MTLPPSTAILMAAYGTVERLDRVAEFLRDVAGGREPSPDLVAEMRRRYEAIGGSPLIRITMAQAAALEAELARRGRPRAVVVGMRHSAPRLADAVRRIAADGHRAMTVLVMAPHYSALSIGRYRECVQEALSGLADPPAARWIERWWHQPRLAEAFEVRIWAALAAHGWVPDDVRVVFTAHSLPVRIREMGDPYEEEVRAHARALAQRLRLPDWALAFQSAGASGEPWLGPDLGEALAATAAEGRRRVLVAPIGFACDHLEILFDLDIEMRRRAGELGLEFARTESLNVSAPFIAALADAVEQVG